MMQDIVKNGKKTNSNHSMMFNHPAVNSILYNQFNDLNMAIDVEDTGKQYIITMDLPGVKTEQMDVTLNHTLLTIKGVRGNTGKVTGHKFLAKERYEGDFCRSVNLPSPVNLELVKACYRHGVLIIFASKSDKFAFTGHVKLKIITD